MKFKVFIDITWIYYINNNKYLHLLDKNIKNQTIIEVENLIELNKKSKYFVNYIDFWFEFYNYIYIQMDFCETNLENIMRLKNKIFADNNNVTQIALNYYISSELLREVIEIIQIFIWIKDSINL